MKTFLPKLTLLTLLSVFAAKSIANERALTLLEQMQEAAHSLAYSGRLVYQQNNELSTFRIQHSAQQGGKESVVLIDPKTGEDIESDRAGVNSFSLVNYNKLQPESTLAYSFDFGNMEQVANISCQVVVARPKDSLRYLHRYCVDPETGMLLKYSLMERGQKLVEQLMFTDILIESPVADKEAHPAVQLAAATSPQVQMATNHRNETGEQWVFRELPLGFSKLREMVQDDGRTQIVLSDGMTSVSVFIEQANDKNPTDDEAYSSGAMNILTHKYDQYNITLMGEVPESTLITIRDELQRINP